MQSVRDFFVGGAGRQKIEALAKLTERGKLRAADVAMQEGPESRILGYLNTHGESHPGEIVKSTGIPTHTLKRMLKNMVIQRLVEWV
jgi:DNA-binding MarR family transcriptional regulator